MEKISFFAIFLTAFLTFCSFVLVQFVIRIIIDPIFNFKEKVGEVSEFFLSHQREFTNANADPDLCYEVRKLSGMLMAKKETLPSCNLTRRIFKIPENNFIEKACGSLNVISTYADPTISDEYKTEKHRSIRIHMKIISQCIKTKVFFGSENFQ